MSIGAHPMGLKTRSNISRVQLKEKGKFYSTSLEMVIISSVPRHIIAVK
jgi:hypothetical protein